MGWSSFNLRAIDAAIAGIVTGVFTNPEHRHDEGPLRVETGRW
jgi:hypothetical protein